MVFIEGKSASPGISSGRAFIYKQQDLSFETEKINDVQVESKRLHDAFNLASGELLEIKNSLSGDLGEEYGHIFRAQMTMVEDEEFLNEIIEIIEEEKLCAEGSLKTIFDGYSEAFSSLGEDDYNRQRLADLADVYSRILRILLGLPDTNLSGVPAGSIVIAEDLMPSDTALMNRENVKGLITEKGGVTSHVAILSKSLGIPAAVGTAKAVSQTTAGDEVLLDSRNFEKASIWIKPGQAEKLSFTKELKSHEEKTALISEMKGKEAITLDGKKIELSANIGSLEDLENALSFGAKSVGLLRTEFFFLGTKTQPDEEKQFVFYKKAAERLNPGMLVIRTLDIGGDKEVGCFELPKEDNPFLGLRGIRVSIKYHEVFKTQLRAIVRASAFGNIKVMFPMIADVSELIYAKKLISEIYDELKTEGKDFNPDMEIGTMVETPAAVFIADLLTEVGDFISIGTNDLTQYVLCADRINENVSEYYRMFSPALIRAIKSASDAALKNGKWTGVCGELGGVAIAIPLLIGIGIGELSMTGGMLPEAVSIIRNLNYSDCKKAADKVLLMKTEEEIKAFLQANFA
ncbi:MAG: phosphoenolpyruvate--protein phosphotransferase [Spirochaetales bacterium]|nr:phosphoenolpyruvate--protein phosphotransferase [Spirochaetales bacterium]